jgi:hypothetical protein
MPEVVRSAQADKSMMLGEVEQLQQEKNQVRRALFRHQ